MAPAVQVHTATLEQKVKKKLTPIATAVFLEEKEIVKTKKLASVLGLTPPKCEICPKMDYNHK